MADVTNYTIENASGANVRTDLNNVFAAIQSSNSKSSDLATSQCVTGMLFLNTTTDILKVRNSNNNGFTEIGNIDSANLGLLPRSGGFSSSGTEQMTFDANGITLNAQNEIRFGDADSSNYVGIKAPSTVSSNRTITLPDESGTLATTANIISSIQGVNLTGLHSLTPASNDAYNLGSNSLRWANIYVNDFNLSNEGGSNDVDMTWGSYTIQEGHNDLFLLNNRTGKKFKFVLQEVS